MPCDLYGGLPLPQENYGGQSCKAGGFKAQKTDSSALRYALIIIIIITFYYS